MLRIRRVIDIAFAGERKSGDAGFKCRNCGSQKIFAKQTKTG